VRRPRAIGWLVSAALVACSLAGCGGSGSGNGGAASPTNPASAPIKARPLIGQKFRVDPDQGPEASADLLATLVSLGDDKYRLEVTNTSSVGYINAFTWFPGPGTTILSVTNTSVDNEDVTGACSLAKGTIVCATSLKPPTCTCRGDGGTVEIDFRARPGRTARDASVDFGSRMFVRSETPVPYVIPSSPDQKPSDVADLPACRSGQRSTVAHPCLTSR
jgi:hypothetical protein